MRQAILVALLCVGIGIGATAQSPVYQLRIYKLHPGNEAHFHDRFRDQCIPIMKRYGFDIVFASQSDASGRAEFVYMLRWKDRAAQVQAWKKFLADEQWIAIKKASTEKFGDLVDEVQDRSLDMLPYTPAPSRIP